MVLVLILLHIIVCLVTGIFMIKSRTKATIDMLPMVIFIPVFGFLSILVFEFRELEKKTGSREIGLDKLRIENAIYKKIGIDVDQDQAITVPLEEAVLINDTSVRRSLMLDILQKNPEEYVGMLKRVTLGNDTELTHYATTTMMELQGDYEKELQKYERKHKRHPEDLKILDEYILRLKKYIESGLLTGNILVIQRNNLVRLLKEAMELTEDNKKYFLQLLETKIELGRCEHMEMDLKRAYENWPEEEQVYMLAVSYCCKTHSGHRIQKILKYIEEHHIYLSREGKEWYQFWSQE